MSLMFTSHKKQGIKIFNNCLKPTHVSKMSLLLLKLTVYLSAPLRWLDSSCIPMPKTRLLPH